MDVSIAAIRVELQRKLKLRHCLGARPASAYQSPSAM
jgi:hypothetical protein